MRDLTRELDAFRETAIKDGIIVPAQAVGIRMKPIELNIVAELVAEYCTCGECQGKLEEIGVGLQVNPEVISSLQINALLGLLEAKMDEIFYFTATVQ